MTTRRSSPGNEQSKGTFEGLDKGESNVKLVLGFSVGDHMSHRHSGCYNNLPAGGLSGNTANQECRATVHGKAT